LEIAKFEQWLFTEGKAAKTIESYVNDVKGFQSYLQEKLRNVPVRFSFVRYKEYLMKEHYAVTRISGSLSPTRVAKVFSDTTKALGWKKKVTAHILRHSFASKLVKNDVHLVKISKLLGHSSLKTTSIYVHSNMDDLKDAVNTL
jgi:site-specific recombinase XerD